jgi:hypothetical protein
MPFITQTSDFTQKGSIINGIVQLSFDGLVEPLEFEIEISPQYPLKNHESESIRFYNKALVEYDHVMENGSICIHTSHHTNLKQKLIIDLNSLKFWIEKYYINSDKDQNYEHIIAYESLVDDRYLSFTFTDVDYCFTRGEYGSVSFSHLNNGTYYSKSIDNFFVQGFAISDKSIKCKWSDNYQNYKKLKTGLFYFLDEQPAQYGRFIYKQWSDFNGLLSSEFLALIAQHDFKDIMHLPIFVGYNTIDGEIHWQVAILKEGSLPLEKTYVEKGLISLPEWKLRDEKINWAISRNSSYEYFFGRGTLCNSLTDSKILILGVGAILFHHQ